MSAKKRRRARELYKDASSRSFRSEYLPYVPLLIFISAVVFHLCFSLVGINTSLTDVSSHSFRQTQTAISTYYMAKDGLSFITRIPVLGAPWSLPFELPVYQMAVASIVRLTHLPLDTTGRIVSLASFYFSIFILFKILREFFPENKDIFLLLSFIFLTPVYIFWSRAFMMESTVILLSLAYLYFTVKFAGSGKYTDLAYAAFFGVLAGLSKATTFLIFLPPAISVFLYFSLYRKTFPGKTDRVLSLILFSVSALAVPILLTFLWSAYADKVRALNPLAKEFLTGGVLSTWLYGAAGQKASFSMWWTLLERASRISAGSVLLLFIPVFSLISNRSYRLHISVCLFSFMLAPLIFTNLYFVHDYYLYANTVFLTLAIGFALLSFCAEYSLSAVQKYLGTIIILFILAYGYFTSYFPRQTWEDRDILEMGQKIRDYTASDETVLIYGYDWDPTIPYYAKRKALMDRNGTYLSNQAIREAIEKTGKDNITAMLTLNINDEFLKKRIGYFGFDSQPVFANSKGVLFVKGKDTL